MRGPVCGRTTQHLGDRVKQHVPRSLLSVEAVSDRPKRGRPRKCQEPPAARPQPKPPPPEQPRRSARLKEKTSAAVSSPSQVSRGVSQSSVSLVSDSANVAVDVDSKIVPESAVHRHLLSSERCRLSYRDSDFSMLFRARSRNHLVVLEAVSIALLRPQLCVQKSSTLSLLSDLSKTP